MIRPRAVKDRSPVHRAQGAPRSPAQTSRTSGRDGSDAELVTLRIGHHHRAVDEQVVIDGRDAGGEVRAEVPSAHGAPPPPSLPACSARSDLVAAAGQARSGTEPRNGPPLPTAGLSRPLNSKDGSRIPRLGGAFRRQRARKLIKAELNWSACVTLMPCGRPLTTTSSLPGRAPTWPTQPASQRRHRRKSTRCVTRQPVEQTADTWRARTWQKHWPRARRVTQRVEGLRSAVTPRRASRRFSPAPQSTPHTRRPGGPSSERWMANQCLTGPDGEPPREGAAPSTCAHMTRDVGITAARRGPPVPFTGPQVSLE